MPSTAIPFLLYVGVRIKDAEDEISICENTRVLFSGSF